MTNSKKYMIWGAAILIAVIALICYASEIQVWMMSKITSLLIIAIAFVLGFVLGRFGRSRSNEQKNARNITEAQK